MYCILNYTSNGDRLHGVDPNSYNYWNNGVYIQLLSDKPFRRGDIAEVLDVTTPSKTECVVTLRSRLEMDLPSDEVAPGHVPYMLLLSTHSPLDPADEYRLEHGSNVNVLREVNNVHEGNLYKTVILVASGETAEVALVNDDESGRRVCEWGIEDIGLEVVEE